MHIKDLKLGEQARLISFGETDVGYRRRLMSLGVTPGVEIRIMRIAPLGCPIQVEIRGTSIALRREEAGNLQWEKI